MAEFLYRTRGNSSPKDKPRVYFTCHPEDFNEYFDKVCEDVFKTHDCVIYYTADMTAVFSDEDKALELGQMNLFVVPVTYRLLAEENRAMNSDIAFAKGENIPVLPFMMESGLDMLYSAADKFGEMQYLNPYSADKTEIRYEEKLKKYLDSVLISEETAKRVRAAFDAYIFLSYRKKDRKYANELMKLIHSKQEFRDVAVWYDEFLTPGESFDENIRKMLKESKLFTLLVTPNLLEKPNYVMSHEYPDAKCYGLNILPVEMEDTDKNSLEASYSGLPNCIDPSDDAEFRERFVKALGNAARGKKSGDPEHNFLIGLAYFDGIDVEVDRKRGIELITSAAEAGLMEAAKKLVDIYQNGIGTRVDHMKVIYWQSRLLEMYTKQILSRKGKSVDFDEVMDYINSMLFLGVKYYDVEDFEKAVENYNAVLDFSKKFSVYLGLNSDTAASAAYNNLGVMYSMKGLLSDSLQYHKKAVGLREKLMRKVPKIVANDLLDSYINLADVYERLGRGKDSVKQLKTAMEFYGKYRDSVEFDLARLGKLHKMLGIVYYGMGDRRQSIAEYGQAQALLKSSLGHGDTAVFEEYADIMYNMGICYVETGKNDDALQCFNEAEKYYVQLYMKDPYSYTCSVMNLYYEIALILCDKKLYGPALGIISAAEKVCATAEKQGREFAICASKVYTCKGEILLEQAMDFPCIEAFGKAEEFLLKTELNNQTAMRYINFYNSFGRACYRLRRNQQSEACYRKAYDIHFKYCQFDKDKRKILGIIYYNFALLCYHNYNDKASAREMMDKAIKVFSKIPDGSEMCLKALEFKRKFLGYF